MKAVERNRRPKKADMITIDDDDSSRDPANVKVEGEKKMEGESAGEPVPVPPTLPSPEMAELREQAAKWEWKFQRACRAARETELRAERAENLLDSKRDVLESVEKKLDGGVKEKMDEMAAQLEEANRRADTAAGNELELTREKDALKEEIEVMRRNALSLQEKNSHLSERMSALTQQMEHEREVSMELRAVYRARIDDLTAQLAESKRVFYHASNSDRPVEKIARMDEMSMKEKTVHPVSSQLDLSPVLHASPSKKKARMEVRTEPDAADKGQSLLQLQHSQPIEPVVPIEPAILDDFDSFPALNDFPMNFDDETQINHETLQHSTGNDLIGQERETEDALKDDEVDNRRRSSRIIRKPLKSVESMEDSDDDSVFLTKRSRSDSVKERENKRNSLSGGSKTIIHRDAKKSDTEMECPECEFRTRSANSWIFHLKYKHSTTPALTGLSLLCECGVECTSNFHSYHCDIANFTVIKNNQKMNRQQCVLCESYPKTAYAYAWHIEQIHKSNLRENGIYLICSCGDEVRSRTFDTNHRKKCDGLQYSLHKLDE